MPLNKPSGNMYPSAYTWNPLAGECPHRCGYCYVSDRIAPMMRRGGSEKYYGELRLMEKEFETRLVVPEGFVVFVESCGDLFADAVPSEWIQRVLDRVAEFPQTTFLLQSKNPKRFREFNIPKNCILGTTLETTWIYTLTKAPAPYERFKEMMLLRTTTQSLMVSVEPVMDFDLEEMTTWIRLLKPKFVSIGADSGNNNLMEPSCEKLKALISELEKITEVRLKGNLSRILEVAEK